ncbi:hypothetical protein [Chryseobacterium sp. MMS23-Vi53]|uniref:hypothetical protein n=1 Tax=Chryseobacterium sp. MMS23-Vi53 TaxID=3386644 RepID=UPI0039EBDD35
MSVSAQEVIWQKDIKSSTQDFLNQITTTIDGQYLITGSSIQSSVEFFYSSSGSGSRPSSVAVEISKKIAGLLNSNK